MSPDTPEHTEPAARGKASRLLWLLGLAMFIASTFYPTDLPSYRQDEGHMIAPETAYVTEHYGRYINTALQIGLPVVLRDGKGLVQLLKVGIATTLATHAGKRLFNNVHVMDTRLGERPSSPATKQNMPSGHSSMASCGFYFTCRRYGWKLAVIMLPVLLLTMYTRVALDQHTVSAVISGALLGILMSALFTTRRVPKTT